MKLFLLLLVLQTICSRNLVPVTLSQTRLSSGNLVIEPERPGSSTVQVLWDSSDRFPLNIHGNASLTLRHVELEAAQLLGPQASAGAPDILLGLPALFTLAPGAQLVMEDVVAKGSAQDVATLQRLLCTSTYESWNQGSTEEATSILIKQWVTDQVNISDLFITVKPSQSTDGISLTDDGGWDYNTPPGVAVGNATAFCAVSKAYTWQQVLRASSGLNQNSDDLHVFLVRNITLPPARHTTVNVTTRLRIAAMPGHPYPSYLSLGFFSEGKWKLIRSESRILFESLWFPTLSLGPFEDMPMSTLPWGIWAVETNRCGDLDTTSGKLVIWNSTLTVVPEMMMYTAHWTTALLSPFPDVRINASWFGADLICNESLPRKLLYAQVEFKSSYSWFAPNAFVLGALLVNTTISDYEPPLGDYPYNRKGLQMTKLFKDPFTPWPDIQGVINTSDLLRHLNNGGPSNILVLDNITITADAWAEFGGAISVKRNTTVSGWPGRTTFIDWQMTSQRIKIMPDAYLTLRNLIMLNPGLGPGSTVHDKLLVNMWPFSFNRSSGREASQLVLEFVSVVVTDAELDLLAHPEAFRQVSLGTPLSSAPTILATIWRNVTFPGVLATSNNLKLSRGPFGGPITLLTIDPGYDNVTDVVPYPYQRLPNDPKVKAVVQQREETSGGGSGSNTGKIIAAVLVPVCCICAVTGFAAFLFIRRHREQEAAAAAAAQHKGAGADTERGQSFLGQKSLMDPYEVSNAPSSAAGGRYPETAQTVCARMPSDTSATFFQPVQPQSASYLWDSQKGHVLDMACSHSQANTHRGSSPTSSRPSNSLSRTQPQDAYASSRSRMGGASGLLSHNSSTASLPHQSQQFAGASSSSMSATANVTVQQAGPLGIVKPRGKFHHSSSDGQDSGFLYNKESSYSDGSDDGFDRPPEHAESTLINRLDMSRELQSSLMGGQDVAGQLKDMVNRMQEELGDQEVDVTRVIGQGGGGTVYMGTWRGLTVAVKTLVFTVLPHQPMSRRQHRAMTEAAICRTLQHPNIVATYAYDLHELRAGPSTRITSSATLGAGVTASSSSSKASHGSGQFALSPMKIDMSEPTEYKLYIVQEYCDGGPLKTAIDDGKLCDQSSGVPRPAPACVLQLATDIAAGMAHVHSRNVVHGDLTPNNVLLKYAPNAESGYVAKVADFGLSWKLSSGQEHVSNARQGTGFYISPEVLHCGIMSKKADVYSFGMILHEMWHGTPFWRHSGADTRIAAVKAQRMASGRLAWDPMCPPVFKDLAVRCLSSDPQMRPSFFHIVESLLAQHAELQTSVVAAQQAARVDIEATLANNSPPHAGGLGGSSAVGGDGDYGEPTTLVGTTGPSSPGDHGDQPSSGSVTGQQTLPVSIGYGTVLNLPTGMKELTAGMLNEQEAKAVLKSMSQSWSAAPKNGGAGASAAGGPPGGSDDAGTVPVPTSEVLLKLLHSSDPVLPPLVFAEDVSVTVGEPLPDVDEMEGEGEDEDDEEWSNPYKYDVREHVKERPHAEQQPGAPSLSSDAVCDTHASSSATSAATAAVETTGAAAPGAAQQQAAASSDPSAHGRVQQGDTERPVQVEEPKNPEGTDAGTHSTASATKGSVARGGRSEEPASGSDHEPWLTPSHLQGLSTSR